VQPLNSPPYFATNGGVPWSAYNNWCAPTASASPCSAVVARWRRFSLETSHHAPSPRDAVHFADIARYGYRYEHSFAFYPLMPVAAGFLARNFAACLALLSELSGWGGYDGSVNVNMVVAAGLFVSVCSFVVMAVFLYVQARFGLLRVRGFDLVLFCLILGTC
jgi:hypothetical protein